MAYLRNVFLSEGMYVSGHIPRVFVSSQFTFPFISTSLMVVRSNLIDLPLQNCRGSSKQPPRSKLPLSFRFSIPDLLRVAA